MSLLSTESSLDTAFKPPSLVFPSLHSSRNSHTNASKYSSKDAHTTNLDSKNNNNEDPSANNQNLQSCIHYASRLIKLRSELRSPAYMNRSNSISESGGGDTIGQLFYKNNCTTFGSGRNNGRNSSLYELSSTHKSPSSMDDHHDKSIISNRSSHHSPSLLSDIGRAQSLPNVTQQQNLYHYDKEDESEIFCHHHHNRMLIAATTTTTTSTTQHTAAAAAEADQDDEQDEEASQLTYLSDLVRASLRRRQTHFHETSDHLALPPRHHFYHDAPKEPRPRSISLRDMINEAIDEAIQQSTTSANDNTTADKPTVLRNSQSFTFASQLLFHASQNSSSSSSSSSQQQQQWHKTDDQEKKGQIHQEQEEKENLFLDTTNVKNALVMTNDKFKEVNIHQGVFDEKVEIPSQATTSVTSTGSSSSSSTSSSRKCNKQAKTTTTTTTITSAAPMPQPSKSRDNKSLFSFISSDSEVDDDDDDDTKTSLSIHSFNKRIIQKRRLQKRPQAFLVSISPSSAAAASVARSRRSRTKQAIRAHHHLNNLLH